MNMSFSEKLPQHRNVNNVVYDVQSEILLHISQSHIQQNHYSQNHQQPPYDKLYEMLISMGYRRDQIASVVQRLMDSDRHVDFNVVLDGLVFQRASSG